MGMRALAEAIMLQAAEDFLREDRQEEDIVFFVGEGFRLCSEMAAMDHAAKCVFLDMIGKSAPLRSAGRGKPASTGSQRVLHIG